LVESIFREWDSFCANQGTGPFRAQKEATNMGNFGYLKYIPLTIYWPECIAISYEAFFGTRRFNFVQIKFLGVINGPTPLGHIFI